jgi:hypothetical protein
MDRTERPARRVAVNPGIAWEDVEKIRDARLGAGCQCANCFHAYEYPVSHQAPVSLVCHHGPGDSQFMQNQVGLALQTVPRVVNKNFFCHQWKTRD